MARIELSRDERARHLNDLARLKSDDDDATEQDPKWFLPLDSHARALRRETMIVRGGRGAGKSALFHFLVHLRDHPELSKVLASGTIDADVSWVPGLDRGTEYPSEAVVGEFAERHEADDPTRRFFWFGWLCWRLAKSLERALPPGALFDLSRGSRLPEPDAIATAARTQLAGLNEWLDALEADGRPTVVTYDRLDRIGGPSRRGQAMTTSLLGMWLAFADRYRHLRAKVFVRDDLYQAAVSAFPDASKLDARSVSIEWRVEDIYRVLLKHMANVSDGLREWISSGGKALEFTLEGTLGWMPPRSLPAEGRTSQKWFVDHLAGERVGTGVKKGYTYLWIPNHLQDAHGRVVPRSILSLIRYAAESALEREAEARGTRLLTPGELQRALTKTSLRRVNEVREEFPVVQRMEELRGKEVMMSHEAAVGALGRAQVDDGFGNDGDAVLRQLIDIGAMRLRADGRVDVPDIYRDGFGIKRRGGIKRAR